MVQSIPLLLLPWLVCMVDRNISVAATKSGASSLSFHLIDLYNSFVFCSFQTQNQVT